ncbi:hypothetical protein KBZ21_40775, partial [Streptomyces sp. A73]|nr:hypothetical protein [Streptomyces sp. A73]
MCEPWVIYGRNQHLETGNPARFHGTREARGLTDDEPEQAELRAERDRARSTAVALENQLAAVRGLHVDSYTTRGVGRG